MTQDASFSLAHLARPPLRESDGPAPAILLLHGVGANEQDLFGLASYLDDRFHVLSVRAPLRLGPQMFGWYQIDIGPDGDFVFDEAQARWSLAMIRDFVDEAIAAYGLDREHFYLVGFSQGAIQGSALLLTEPEKVAGLVAMSGRWPTPVEGEIAADARLADKPVLAVHGLHDPVIPIRYGRALRERWEALPVAFSYEEFAMAHQVSPESLECVRQWLAARLAAKGDSVAAE